MAKTEKVKVLVTLPRPLLRRLDAEATRQQRDRSSELARRLDRDLPPLKSKTATA